MACPNCITLSFYVCREIVRGYEHFDDVRRVFFRPLPPLTWLDYSHDLASLDGGDGRQNACFGTKSKKGMTKRSVCLTFFLFLCSMLSSGRRSPEKGDCGVSE